MTVPLESLASCFQGLIPAQLFTCSSDGVPNAAYLSHVDYVDARHVALSFQFFNKSRRNISENPQAQVVVVDPDTWQVWNLRLRYVRSETTGPLFDRMALRIEAIASYCNLKGVFKLLAADVYEVLAIEPSAQDAAMASRPDGAITAAPAPVFTLSAMQALIERVQHTDSVDSQVDAILDALERDFGFRHSMLLLPTEQEGVLVTMAARGYRENGAGAEVRFGEGIGGLVAEARKPIRIAGLLRGMLYALAMHRRMDDPPAIQRTHQIPVPALDNPDSQLGIPLLVRGELVGVLCLESEAPYRFHEEDKAMIEVLGSYLGLALQSVQLQDRASDVAVEAPVTVRNGLVATPTIAYPDGPRRCVVFHVPDECVLIDGEYLIRGLPARILWRLLTIRESTGRCEFTNRELRLDKSLNLPEWKDNLESRLILLRRRLEQKCVDVRLVPRGRGRFALEVTSTLALREQD